jgi:hypothetical protein
MPSMSRSTAEGMDEALGQETYSRPSLALGSGSGRNHNSGALAHRGSVSVPILHGPNPTAGRRVITTAPGRIISRRVRT